MQFIRPALVLTILFTLLTGLLYPLAMTGVATAAFPSQAGGSLLRRGDVVLGSRLIGQNFAAAKYFHPRPSATSMPDPQDATRIVDAPYNAANSSGSNLGPTSQKLIDRVKKDADDYKAGNNGAAMPGDAATTSASGLDPHISPANALSQVARIAAERKLPTTQVEDLVRNHTEGRFLGLFGEPRVNVLLLNLALDDIKAG